MKWFAFLAALFLSLMAGPILAAEDPRETAQEALGTFAQECEQELATWCKGVHPGKGRLLGCLYAYEDKLSPACAYALYGAAAQLERALSSLTYTENECRDDIAHYCADIKQGEGRLFDCLQKNEAKLSSRCQTALQDVGM
jgi:hypothetical protein